MKIRFPFARTSAGLLLAACASHAQAQTPQAADAQAAVPATRYQSTLGAHPEAASATPDQNWVAGNQLVAATNSMALTMKPMAGHAGHGGAPAQSADPHAGHDMHNMPGMQGMQGMNMGKQDSPAMCAPAGAESAGKGMQCMGGEGKMSCCQPCCCTDRMHPMNKPKEAT